MAEFEVRTLPTAPTAAVGGGLQAWVTGVAWPAGWRAWAGASVRDELDTFWSADAFVLAPALGVGFVLVEAPVRLARERPADRDSVGWVTPAGVPRRPAGIVRRPFVRLTRMIAPLRRRLRQLDVEPLPVLCGLVVERLPPAAADEDPLDTGIVAAAEAPALVMALVELAERLGRHVDPAWAGYLSAHDSGPTHDMFAAGVDLERGAADGTVDPLAPAELLERASRYWAAYASALDEDQPLPDVEIWNELALADRGLLRLLPPADTAVAGRELASKVAAHGYAPHEVAWLGDDHDRLLHVAPLGAVLPGDPDAAGRPLCGAAADFAESAARRRLVVLLDPPKSGARGARLRAIAAAAADEALWLTHDSAGEPR